jgi:hypothetical protein
LKSFSENFTEEGADEAEAQLLGDRSFVLPVKTASLSSYDVWIMQLSGLTFAVVVATADLLDHDDPPTRFLDGFDRFALASVDILGIDVLAVLEEVADLVLEGA